MTEATSAIPPLQFPNHSKPRVWLLSSGASPFGIELARQLLTHGDLVVFGRKPKDISEPNNQRASDFTAFWTEEVLVEEGWKDRAKVVGLDGRCEDNLRHRHGWIVDVTDFLVLLQEHGPMSSCRCRDCSILQAARHPRLLLQRRFVRSRGK